MTDSTTVRELAPAGRQHLANRRGHELVAFEHGGQRYIGGIGRFADGRLAEIFLNCGKAGSAAETNARDSAIAASLLFQFGCPVDTIRHALTRDGNGVASGPLGHLLDILVEGSHG